MNEYLVHFSLLSNQCKKICRNLKQINGLFPTLRRSLWNYPEHINIDRVLPRECTGHSKHSLSTTQEKTLHKMVNNKIRLIIFFATKDREALYSQQKQDLELTVAQIMSSLLQNSGSV